MPSFCTTIVEAHIKLDDTHERLLLAHYCMPSYVLGILEADSGGVISKWLAQIPLG